MQAFHDHLVHIHFAEEIDDTDLLQVLVALENTQFAFEARRDWLAELITKALDGCDDSLERFLLETEGLLPEDRNIAETELFEMASELPQSSWETPLWRDFISALDAADAALWEDFDSKLEIISSKIEAALDQYSQLRIKESEVTRETVLGNQLLMQGLQDWQRAIEAAIEAAESDSSWDLALQEAERGCRFLVTLSIHSESLQLAA